MIQGKILHSSHLLAHLVLDPCQHSPFLLGEGSTQLPAQHLPGLVLGGNRPDGAPSTEGTENIFWFRVFSIMNHLSKFMITNSVQIGDLITLVWQSNPRR